MKNNFGEFFYFKDKKQFIENSSQLIFQRIVEASSSKNIVYIAVSGGSTPYPIFENLVHNHRNHSVWNSVHVYWVDERFVAHDNVESNFGNAFKSLIQPIGIKNYFPVTILETAEKSASSYQNTLIKNYGISENEIPAFDLILLGMGNDGHVASLFPKQDNYFEKKKLIHSFYIDKLKAWRISMGYELLNNAKSRIFLLSGKEKANLIRDLSFAEDSLPIQKLFPSSAINNWCIFEGE